MSKWQSTRTPPEEFDRIWIRRELTGIEMGEFVDGRYVSYGASADGEGLSVEYFSDVTHWAFIEQTPFDYKETT
jgi:hypothetical protein